MSPTSYRTAPPRVKVNYFSAKPTLELGLKSEILKLMVGLGRFELPTSRLSGVRSNQLSYRPISLCWRDFAAKKSHTSLGVRSVLTVDTPEGRLASVAMTYGLRASFANYKRANCQFEI